MSNSIQFKDTEGNVVCKADIIGSICVRLNTKFDCDLDILKQIPKDEKSCHICKEDRSGFLYEVFQGKNYERDLISNTCDIVVYGGCKSVDILAGLDLGADPETEEAYDENGFTVLDRLIDRIPYEKIQSETLAFMDKYAETKPSVIEELFMDVTREDVERGQYNLVGVIAQNDCIYPFASAIYDAFEDDIKLCIGISEGEGYEFTLDIPLMQEEKDAIRKELSNKVNIYKLQEISREGHKKLKTDVER